MASRTRIIRGSIAIISRRISEHTSGESLGEQQNQHTQKKQTSIHSGKQNWHTERKNPAHSKVNITIAYSED
jgi:hypothetical protein